MEINQEDQSRRDEFNFIADMVSEIYPAMVHIMMQDAMLDISTENPQPASGSGFIIDPSGLILTNAHVVTANPGSKINVQLPDGQICEGVVESLDVFLDLASVRINCPSTPMLTMKLGDSDTLRAGEFVVALGSPLSLSNTVTTGVISNTARSMADLGMPSGETRQLIQTDAFVTFGNSGGPLVNLDGEVVGINSMSVGPGCSFAIPINVAKKFLKDAVDGVFRDRANMQNMGVALLELNPMLVVQLKMQGVLHERVTHGLMVVRVVMGSPAYIAGIRPGDIIFQMDGRDLTRMLDFVAAFWGGKGNIKMRVIRGDSEVIITV
jgi:HtrA serine peptidase 2